MWSSAMMEYHNNPKYWDKQTCANSTELDQIPVNTQIWVYIIKWTAQSKKI